MVCCMILMEELINLITSWFFAVYPANGLSNCNPNWQFEKEVSLSNTVMRDDHCYLRFQCPIYCCNQHNYLGYHVCISFPFHGFGLISEPCVVCLSRNHILKLPVILCNALNSGGARIPNLGIPTSTSIKKSVVFNCNEWKYYKIWANLRGCFFYCFGLQWVKILQNMALYIYIYKYIYIEVC